MEEKDPQGAPEFSLEAVRQNLQEKTDRIAALENALPTLGAGLIAEAVVHYLLALNSEFLVTCRALADIAAKARTESEDAPNAEPVATEGQA